MHQQARYVEGMNTATWSGFVADRVISASGLSWITQAGTHAFGLELQGFLADNIGLSFGDLDPAVRRMFQRHGIAEADWNRIRSADLYEPHAGARFLRPQEIEAKAGVDVAEKYLGMILRETRYAVPEGGVRSRSFLASGRPGTFTGELGRNFAQFKSFGVAVILLHGGRIAREFQAGNVRSATAMTLGMAVSAAIAGVIVNELLEIINGREPVIAAMLERGEAPGWEYWGAGLLRAGGLGIYGDFLFQGLSRAGGLASVLIGPVGGFADRIRARSLGSAQEGLEGKDMRLGREGVATLREIMPGSTLWYARLVKERWFLNQMQLALDPDANRVFERHMAMQKKNYGNEYWWKPGEAAPAGLPWRASPPGVPAAPATPPKAGPKLALGAKIAQTDAKRFVVVDGDTVAVDGHHWRLTGYDTPEVYKGRVKTKERFVGIQAAVRLGELLRSGKAELEVTDAPDRWGRGRARLTIDGRDVADVMKDEGLVKKKR
jgi:endonuclease YncB( thermonuclease family)